MPHGFKYTKERKAEQGKRRNGGQEKKGNIYGSSARTRISTLLKSMDILARKRSFVCASSLYTTYHVLNSLSSKNNPPAKTRRFAGGYAVNAYKAFGIDSAAFSFSNCSAGYIFLSANPPLYMFFVRKLAVDENPVNSVKFRFFLPGAFSLLCLPFPLMSNNLISHLFCTVWGFVHFRGCFMLTLVFFSLKYAARGKMW